MDKRFYCNGMEGVVFVMAFIKTFMPTVRKGSYHDIVVPLPPLVMDLRNPKDAAQGAADHNERVNYIALNNVLSFFNRVMRALDISSNSCETWSLKFVFIFT